MKRILKHEPTSSYYCLVGCNPECMLRSDEDNQHVHSGYAEETSTSSNVNDTGEDKSEGVVKVLTEFSEATEMVAGGRFGA